MKNVTYASNETIRFDNLTPDYIIGFDMDSLGKGFGMALRTKKDGYILAAVNNLTSGNHWGTPGASFHECMDCLKKIGAKIFVFDSTEELLKWLII